MLRGHPLAQHVGLSLVALRWLLFIALGWVFKKGGASSGGGGGGVTWANDLAGSSNTHQWLAAISGPGGAGGVVPVANATDLTFVRTGKTAATAGRINFSVDEPVLLALRSHGDTNDLNVISSTGAGEATVFGDNTPGLQDAHLLGDTVVIAARSTTNQINLNASAAGGIQFFFNASQIDFANGVFTVTNAPATFDVNSPITESAYIEFVPATSPTPANAVLIGKADSTTIGAVVKQVSDQLMVTTLAPAGDSARPSIDRMEKTLLAVGAGGNAAVTFPIPVGVCVYAEITVLGVTAAAAAGCKLSATATIRNDAGTATLVAAAAASSNPKTNPYADDATDGAFGASSLTITASLATLRVQVNNAGAGANDFAVFVEFKGFHA
jgi:hypothetical protein